MITEDFPDISEIRTLLQSANRLVIASSLGKSPPRATPVFYAASEAQGKIYWLSSPNAQHSKNIEANGTGSVLLVDGSLYSGHVGKPYRVVDAQERAQAYALLHEKAETLPETLADLDDPNSLRDLYAFHARGGLEDWNDSQYVVLGTLDGEELDEDDYIGLDNVSFEIKDGQIVAGLFPSRFNDNIHACLYDSTAKQGTGIGLYFSAIARDNMTREIKISALDALYVNGAVLDLTKPGWVDQRKKVMESVLS